MNTFALPASEGGCGGGMGPRRAGTLGEPFTPRGVDEWRLIHRKARSRANLLLEGGSMGAQEVLARTVHRMGGGSARGFRTVRSEDGLDRALLRATDRENCGEAGDLLSDPRPTLFVGGVDGYSRRGQQRLLEVLDRGAPGGGGFSRRWIFGSQRPLEEEVNTGFFSSALFFRLAVLRLILPEHWEPAGSVVAPAELWSLLDGTQGRPLCVNA